MTFHELLEHVQCLSIRGEDVAINDIAVDSRAVKPGTCFVAVQGASSDGHDYISQAIENGATAIILDKREAIPENIPCARIQSTRRSIGTLAASFFGNPSEKLWVCGITGTNGKTSTTYLAEALLSDAGFSVGVIGTINYRYAGKVFPAATTTPGPVDLQRHMAAMVEAGVSHLLMEVSSHALDQYRVDGTSFDMAVFTNLTRDHLDYHADMEDYFNVKRRLFTRLLEQSRKPDRVAATNIDDPAGERIVMGFGGRTIRMSLQADSQADIHAESLSVRLAGTKLRLSCMGERVELDSPMIGAHNARNIIQAIAIGIACGLSPQAAAKGAARLKAIPGRLERAGDNTHDVFVFVDYSHTPDALENVLQVLSELNENRVIALIGCGGDRDRGKRPLMGAVAGRLADCTVLTSDNPRTEDPAAILAEIEPGVIETGQTRGDPTRALARGEYVVIESRADAIATAIANAESRDTILIAGKGHEDYQIVGTVKHHFDDREQALAALAERKKAGQ